MLSFAMIWEALYPFRRKVYRASNLNSDNYLGDTSGPLPVNCIRVWL